MFIDINQNIMFCMERGVALQRTSDVDEVEQPLYRGLINGYSVLFLSEQLIL